MRVINVARKYIPLSARGLGLATVAQQPDGGGLVRD